jgi:hypothetical protein
MSVMRFAGYYGVNRVISVMRFAGYCGVSRVMSVVAGTRCHHLHLSSADTARLLC